MGACPSVLPRARGQAGPSRLPSPPQGYPVPAIATSSPSAVGKATPAQEVVAAADGGGERPRGEGRVLDALTQHPSELRLVPAPPGSSQQPSSSEQDPPHPQFLPGKMLRGRGRATHRGPGKTPTGSDRASTRFPRSVAECHQLQSPLAPFPPGRMSLPLLSCPSSTLPLGTQTWHPGCASAWRCLGMLHPAAPEFALAGPASLPKPAPTSRDRTSMTPSEPRIALGAQQTFHGMRCLCCGLGSRASRSSSDAKLRDLALVWHQAATHTKLTPSSSSHH